MNKNLHFLNLMAIIVILFFAGCALPHTEKQTASGEVADAPDIPITASSPTQYPKVYDINISGREIDHAYLGSMVWTGSEYGIVWYGGIGDGYPYLYLTRLNKYGVKIGEDFKVSSQFTYFEPSIVWTGLEYGIAWTSQADIYFARVHNSEVVPYSLKRITSSLNNGAPSLIWTGNQFAIVWCAGQHADQHIYFATISIDGYVSDPKSISDGGSLFISGARGTVPVIAYNKYDNEYGVVYLEEYVSNNSYATYVYFVTVNSSGKVLSRKRISKAENCSLAWSNTSKEYAVVWNLPVSGTENTKIYYTTFSRNGEMGEKHKLSSGHNPQITWNADDNTFGICWKYNEDKKLAFLEVIGGKAPDTDNTKHMTLDGPIDISPYIIYNKNSNKYAVIWNSWDTLNERFWVYFTQFDKDGTKSAQGIMKGGLKGTQPGYYLIRSVVQKDYLTTLGSDVYHAGYYFEYPASQLWELVDDDNNVTFKLINHGCGKTLAGMDVSVGGILSMEKKDVGDCAKWYLYSYDDDGTYLVRLAYNDDYRIYAHENTVKLSKSSSNGKKFQLIPWGYY